MEKYNNSNVIEKNELYIAVKEVHQILTDKSREIGELQKSIILRNRIEEVKEKANIFYSDQQTDLETRFKVFREVIPLIRESLNKLANEKEYEELWLILASYNSVILSALAFGGGSDPTNKFEGQAHLLSHMLMGVPRIELTDTSQLPKDRKWFELRRYQFNALSTTITLLQTAISTVFFFGKSDLDEWVNSAFWHYKVLLEFIDSLNYKLLWEFNKENSEEFYRKVFSSILPINGFPNFIYIIYQLYGHSYDDKLDFSQMMDNLSIESIFDSSQRMTEYIQRIINTIIELYDKGVIDRNAKPNDSLHFKRINGIKISIDRTSHTINAFKTNLLTGTKNPETLELAIIKTYEHLEFLEWLVKSRDNIFKSSIGITYKLVINQLIALNTLKALNSQNFESYMLFCHKYNFLFNKDLTSELSDTLFIQILSQLYLETHLSKEVDLQKYKVQMEQIINTKSISPTEFIARNLLYVIIRMLIKDIQIDEVNQIFDVINQFTISQGLNHIQDYVLLYCDNLLTAYKGDEPIYQLPPNLEKINELDPFTWIIPDFSILANKSRLGTILYIPFNIVSNRVLRSINNKIDSLF
jgi:hypothetical protein